MAIRIPQGYVVTSHESIDSRFVLTYDQMRNADDRFMPVVYFAVGLEDKKLWIYDRECKNPDPVTGKYRLFAGSWLSLEDKPMINGRELKPTTSSEGRNNTLEYLGIDRLSLFVDDLGDVSKREEPHHIHSEYSDAIDDLDAKKQNKLTLRDPIYFVSEDEIFIKIDAARLSINELGELTVSDNLMNTINTALANSAYAKSAIDDELRPAVQALEQNKADVFEPIEPLYLFENPEAGRPNTLEILLDEDTLEVTADGKLTAYPNQKDLLNGLPSNIGDPGQLLVSDGTKANWMDPITLDNIKIEGEADNLPKVDKVVTIPYAMEDGSRAGVIRVDNNDGSALLHVDNDGKLIVTILPNEGTGIEFTTDGVYTKIGLDDTVEKNTNKAISFNAANVDDIHYPTVRLVKNALDDKQDKLTAGAALKIDAGVISTLYDQLYDATKYTIGLRNGYLEARDIRLPDGQTYFSQMLPDYYDGGMTIADRDWTLNVLATATGVFRGNYPDPADLPNPTMPDGAEVKNNDYAFITETYTSEGLELTRYKRYKFSVSKLPDGTLDKHWDFEYEISTTAFTPAQIAAMNSGITAALRQGLQDLLNTVWIAGDGISNDDLNGTPLVRKITVLFDSESLSLQGGKLTAFNDNKAVLNMIPGTLPVVGRNPQALIMNSEGTGLEWGEAGNTVILEEGTAVHIYNTPGTDNFELSVAGYAAGPGITITPDPTGLSLGTISGTVNVPAFADLTGDPYDNAALKNALDDKQKKITPASDNVHLDSEGNLSVDGITTYIPGFGIKFTEIPDSEGGTVNEVAIKGDFVQAGNTQTTVTKTANGFVVGVNADSEFSNVSTNPAQSKAIAEHYDPLIANAKTKQAAYDSGTVATSGLADSVITRITQNANGEIVVERKSLPTGITVNDAKLTLKSGTTTLGVFTANQASDVEIDLDSNVAWDSVDGKPGVVLNGASSTANITAVNKQLTIKRKNAAGTDVTLINGTWLSTDSTSQQTTLPHSTSVGIERW